MAELFISNGKECLNKEVTFLMAKIELYKDKINNMSNLFEDLRSKKSSYAMNLNKLSTNLMAIECVDLASAISELSTVNKDVDEQIEDLNKLQREFEDYVLSVKTIDNKVAEYIRGLPEFYLPYYSPSKNWTQNTKLPTAAEYIRALPKTGEPYRSNLEWRNQKDQLATASEYISKIHLKINKFIRDFAPYMVSEYIEYDSENHCYKVKDKQKLNELLTKESPSETDLAKMAYIFSLTVDDDGNIDTEFLKQLIKCSYKEQRHYSEGEIIDSYNTSKIPYEYYTTYTRSKSISSICEGLSDEKYRELNLILLNLNEEIEGAHLRGEVLYKLKRLEYGEYKEYESIDYITYIEDKFAYIEQENEKYILGFDVNIETSDLLDSNCEKRIKKYDITYSTSIKDTSIKDKNKKENDTIYKEDYPSYTVYQYADNDSLIARINADIKAVAENNINDNIIKAFNSLRQDGKMRYHFSNYLKNVGLEGLDFAADKKIDKLDKALGTNGYLQLIKTGLNISIGEIQNALDAAEEAKKNQEYNLRLQDKELELLKERNDLLITEKLINEARLRGYNGNYVISKDSSGRFTDITFANLTINDYDFEKEYQDYQIYCDGLKKTRPNDGISHFDDLTPELQNDMLYWKIFIK